VLYRVLEMPVPFPHHYQTWMVRTLSSRARLEAPPRPLISGGPPPEFDGDATAWSAEQLMLSSIGLSVLTTFEAFAARDRVDLLGWEARVGGTVDRGELGPQLQTFRVEVDRGGSDVGRARGTVDGAPLLRLSRPLPRSQQFHQHRATCRRRPSQDRAGDPA